MVLCSTACAVQIMPKGIGREIIVLGFLGRSRNRCHYRSRSCGLGGKPRQARAAVAPRRCACRVSRLVESQLTCCCGQCRRRERPCLRRSLPRCRRCGKSRSESSRNAIESACRLIQPLRKSSIGGSRLEFLIRLDGIFGWAMQRADPNWA